MKLAKFAIGGCLPLFFSLAHAGSPEMETTVVSATRVEQSIAEVLAPVSVFERADIERIAPLDLQELLSRATGVAMLRNGGRGSVTSLFLRGNNSNHTLVLIDGVRVSSATSGSPALNNLPPELIERVEIVRGPRSVLYGSEAIGGVVNIITKKFHDTDGVKPFVQLSAGSNNTLKAMAALNGGNADTQFSLSLLHDETDGVDNTSSTVGLHGDDDAFEQQAVNFSLTQRINDRASLYAMYQRSDSENDYDSNCYVGWTTVDCAPYGDNSVSVGSLRGEFLVSDNWKLTLSAGRSGDQSKTKYDYLDPAAPSGDIFKTTRKQGGLQNDFTLSEAYTLTVGAEYFSDKVKSTQSYDKGERDAKAGYAQWQADHGLIDYVLGWRYEDNEQFGSHNTRNAAAGLDLTSNIKVVLSYGEGFNAPSFNDLYYPGYGNANLEPEQSKNREVEIRGQQSWGRWSLNYFTNDVEKLIAYNPITSGPDQIDSARIKGVEASVSTVIAMWHVDANITLLDTEDRDLGKELRRRPDRQANINVDREWDRWGVNASLRLVGGRYEDAANTDELSGYGLLDAGVSYRLREDLSLKFAVKNALDKEYISARGGSLGNYESVGREALLSITYNP